MTMVWVFFRAPTFGQAIDVFKSLGTDGAGEPGDLYRLALFGGLMAVHDTVRPRLKASSISIVDKPILVGVSGGAAALSLFIFSGTASVPFIYFQF